MKKIFLLSSLVILLSGCAIFQDLSDIKKPSVRYSSMSIQNISFSEVTLLFDFEVENPNRFGVSADQYSYEFFINENSFLSGTQSENIRVSRESKSTVQVPVTVSYTDMFGTFSSLMNRDSFAYELATEVRFSIRGMGQQKIPVKTSGELPIPRMPTIEFGGFNIKQISMAGAELEVALKINNPNTFGISLANAVYALTVNGREWLDTGLDRRINLNSSSSETIHIPIRLNASQMGSVLLDMMRGSTEFDYRLTGSADVSADIEGFDDGTTVPFDLDGRYSSEEN